VGRAIVATWQAGECRLAKLFLILQMGSGMILDFPAGREFGSEFFNFRVNATVAYASLCINSGVVRVHYDFPG